MRHFVTVILAMLWANVAFADSEFSLNFDLNMARADGSPSYSIQQQGLRLIADKPFRGNDLGKYDYFLTVSEVANGKGKFTVEFYEYETQRKVSDVVSEFVTAVDFTVGVPAVLDGKSETFGINLAFNISER